jgi:hypothetical protein
LRIEGEGNGKAAVSAETNKASPINPNRAYTEGETFSIQKSRHHQYSHTKVASRETPQTGRELGAG